MSARMVAAAFLTLVCAAGVVRAEAAQKKGATSKARAPETVTITLKTDPAQPKTGSNRFDVTVTDRAGKPVADAAVTITLVMPAAAGMPMPEMRSAVKLKPAGDGKYAGAGDVMMAGRWDALVSVKRGGREIGSKKFVVDAK